MKIVDDQLAMSITNTYQIGSHDRQPIQYVYVHNRHYGKKNDVFKVPFGRLPGVISIDTNWDTDAAAGSFTIVCQNKDGLLSPDYYFGKTPMALALRGHLDSPWRGQLKPNTKIEIHWGYGKYTTRDMTGLIDNVEINAAAQTITIRGRSMRKLLITNTVTPLKGHSLLIPYETMKMEDAINRLIVYAGLTLKKKPIIDPDTGEEYLVAAAIGKRGENYNELVAPLVDSVLHILFEDSLGDVHLRDKPKYSQEEAAVFVVDDAINITDLDFENADVDVFGTVLVEAHSNAIDAFSSSFITNTILNKHRREKRVNYPWTTTQKRRQLAAASEFINMLYKFRTITVNILADPRLELYDTIRIQERISTAQWNYNIKGIQTTFSASGFTQQLQCASNFEFKEYEGTLEDLEPGDEPNVKTSEDSIRIGVWDMGARDLDVISLQVNGEIIEGNIVLTETPQFFTIDLKEKGNYEIKFIGVSAGRSDSLHFGYTFQNEDGTPLAPIASFDFARTNVNKYGFYKKKRPSESVVVRKNA